MFAPGAPEPARWMDYNVELWRLMLHYPELLAWENLWHDSLRETYAAIYAKVKSIKPSMGVGWHIWHNNSFSPIYRAEQDLQRIAPHSDFLKIVIYNNVAGERMASYIDSVGATQYGDVPKEELLEYHYRILNYKNEGTYEQIPHTGFSSDYVLRETKRAHAGLAGAKTKLWPGIDVEVPTARGHSKCTRARSARRRAGRVPRGRQWRDSVAQILRNES